MMMTENCPDPCTTEYIYNDLCNCKQLIAATVFDPYFSTEIIGHFYNGLLGYKGLVLNNYAYNDDFKYIDISCSGIEYKDLKSVLDNLSIELFTRYIKSNEMYKRLLNISIDKTLEFGDIVNKQSYLLQYLVFNIMLLSKNQDGSLLIRLVLV